MSEQKQKNNRQTKRRIFKEVKFRPNIADNDLNTKVKQIRKFLDKQMQVRITVKMRGRENIYRNLAHNLLNKIEVATKDIGRMDKGRRDAGQTIQTMVSPLKSKK